MQHDDGNTRMIIHTELRLSWLQCCELQGWLILRRDVPLTSASVLTKCCRNIAGLPDRSLEVEHGSCSRPLRRSVGETMRSSHGQCLATGAAGNQEALRISKRTRGFDEDVNEWKHWLKSSWILSGVLTWYCTSAFAAKSISKGHAPSMHVRSSAGYHLIRDCHHS